MRSSICKDDLNAQRLQKRLKRSDK
jgi:hypothetical protein